MSNYLTTQQKIENVIAELNTKHNSERETLIIKGGYMNAVHVKDETGEISSLSVNLRTGFVSAAGLLSSELKGFYNLYNRP